MTENDHDVGNLSDKQLAVLDNLANGATKEQAAVVGGVSLRTINRWIADDPIFNDALKQITSEAVSNGARRLAAMLEDSITALHEIVTNTNAKDRDKLRAIELNVNNLVKLLEFDDMVKRIEALETQAMTK